ncbi:PAS-domain containing protein [Roseovarius sp. SCSIO 43702]|uniref:hybrid sensor histidine kinase/response regulator n=1 Tax=Roseovarius sp. SCSIO 43702 TaxID=2823043 RepID=UPI001C72C55C|nr:PAS-domain containing protein [Roseovarius sp. SCSIO 43702]QYX57067.1 PAS-domain containing protein [Roseovarius sp. SCSIO 43702]
MTDHATRQPDTTSLTMAGLNLIQQALSIYDDALRLVICNARFQAMFDLPAHLVTPGASFEDTLTFLAHRGDYGDVDDLQEFVRDRVEIARAFEPHYMERTRANGRTIAVEGTPLPQGGWVTVYTDITRTKRQEALLKARSDELSDQLSGYSEDLAATNRKLEATITALEEAKRQVTASEARTRLTTEMMPAHIAHVGPDRRYTYSNRRLSSIMPGSKASIVGERVEDALGPEAFSAIEARLDAAFDGDASVFEFTHAPSSRRIRAAFTPDEETGGVYILSMDITEEAQTRAALQQTRRREVAAQMTSGLAHDFSNLLTIILGMQSRLGRIDGLPDEAAALVQATVAAAKRGGSLLNRIADMTSERKHDPVPVNLAKFLADLDPLARSVLPDGVTFGIVSTIGNARLMLEAGMLQDALLNLVLNAKDACGETGEIELAVSAVKDTWIDFTVSDTGPGFSDHALRHAFDPFFTTKGEGGTGLGLVMVYDVTKLAGGRVTLENRQKGACVTLRLPLRPAPDAETPGLVLLLEDNAEIRGTLRDILCADGHTVVEATTASEARTLMRELPEISVVVSDIVLEGEETGIDLLRSLPHDHPPVVLMTSLPVSDPRHVAARELVPVLRKPVAPDRLRSFLLKESVAS